MPTQKVLQRRGRDRLGIICQILETASEGALKTQIMYKVNLSYANLHAYLPWLKELGLIEEIEENGNQVLKVTENGRQYIQAYRGIHHLLIAEEAAHAVNKKSKLVVDRRTASTEELFSTRDELLLVVNDHERLFRVINSRLSSLEKKLDAIHAELKGKQKNP